MARWPHQATGRTCGPRTRVRDFQVTGPARRRPGSSRGSAPVREAQVLDVLRERGGDAGAGQ
ncbi:hypothetical protein [Crossiella sp. NPDC003009]